VGVCVLRGLLRVKRRQRHGDSPFETVRARGARVRFRRAYAVVDTTLADVVRESEGVARSSTKFFDRHGWRFFDAAAMQIPF
jgi:hypothetical protein